MDSDYKITMEQAETEKKRKNMKLALLKSQIDAVEQHMEEGIEDSPVVKAAEYMKQDPAISREELAEKLYMSPVHLARIFKKETGMTLNEWRRRKVCWQIQEKASAGSQVSSAIRIFHIFPEYLKKRPG